MKKFLLLIFLCPSMLFAQRSIEYIESNLTGDQEIALGRYRIGSAIRIECQVSGPWAEDGGIYHIVSDWASKPMVLLRSESSITNRLKFYGYVDTSSNGYAFLYAKWENQSPDKSERNNVKFTISSEGTIDLTSTGSFSTATELENVMIIQANTGNVGIGSTDPINRLEIADAFSFHDGAHEVIGMGWSHGANARDLNPNGHAGQIKLDPTSGLLQLGVSSTVAGEPLVNLTLSKDGNVGIGTADPKNDFEVRHGQSGGVSIKRSSMGDDIGEGLYLTGGGHRSDSDWGAISAGVRHDMGTYFASSDAASGIIFKNGGISFNASDGLTSGSAFSFHTRMYISSKGNVGIGTIETGSHRLAVHGSIGAREIKVEANDWSDFVFEPEYKLLPLEEVERHISKKGHLPEIPSEAEVMESGINLGEMNAKLLQKIEELTLYLIEEHKNNLKLKEEIEELKSQVRLLDEK